MKALKEDMRYLGDEGQGKDRAIADLEKRLNQKTKEAENNNLKKDAAVNL